MDDTVGQQLEQDHHRIDEDFAQFARSLSEAAADREAFDTAAQALRHHIYVEEELHFPILRSAGLLAPVLVMLREHGQIWDHLDTIAAALDNGDDATVRTSWPELATVLEAHNAKEERILYPAGDQQISPVDAERIAAALAAGNTPPDWVCEMAGRGGPA